MLFSCGAAEGDSRLPQMLVLVVQRQMVLELVDQHVHQEAGIGDTVVQHIARYRAGQRFAPTPALEYQPATLLHHVTGRLLV